MILLDTHAWIWWASASPKMSKKALKVIDGADKVLVSAISCWETAMLVSKGRLTLDRDVEVWIDLALKLPNVHLASLTPSIAVRSCRLGSMEGDPPDRIIVATAMQYGCKLVSKDERIKKFKNVRVVW
ncbi:MAG: type II toxin-antitoxin system VapC family toxin [Nitrospira sp.]|nr:type II toxin-antitoxin system VapC family toxin [Nitrospira sp.]